MANVAICRFALSTVLEKDKVRFNSANHFKEGERPDDYTATIRQCDTRHWVDKFHTRYHTITLDAQTMLWLRKAVQLGTLTGRVSPLYKDNITRTCAKYAEQMKVLEGCDWFVRTDGASLKYGQHHAGPYRTLKPILESMITGIYGHEPFDDDATTCTLYFLPWIDMDKDTEFRVFVYQNHITALSAQHIYQKNDWLSTQSDSELKAHVQRILAYFASNIRDKLKNIGSYTMDVALVGVKKEPYFIEPNTFGAKYAAGSALFHWLQDHTTLHEANTVELRFVDNA